jgi:hypothetical protein
LAIPDNKGIIMKEYIFYTGDGYTEDENCEQTENLQVLAVIEADSYKEAKAKFLTQGFVGSYTSITCREISGERKYIDCGGEE